MRSRAINLITSLQLSQNEVNNVLLMLGQCKVASYSQIKTFYNSESYAEKRVQHMCKMELIEGDNLGLPEKNWWLRTDGCAILKDRTGFEYRAEKPDFDQITHMLRRTDFYLYCKKIGATNWKRESYREEMKEKVKGFGKTDASFNYNKQLYFLEVVNMQKMDDLETRLENYAKLIPNFIVVIYCRNKDVVKERLKKMKKKGFEDRCRYPIKVIAWGEEIVL